MTAVLWAFVWSALFTLVTLAVIYLTAPKGPCQ